MTDDWLTKTFRRAEEQYNQLPIWARPVVMREEMPRGKKAEIGDTTVNKNGYHYTRTKGGWVGTHVLVMEEHLGRQLESNEYVAFKNGHQPPVTIDMIVLRQRGDRKSKAARIAEIESRIEDLQAERDILKAEENAT